MPDIQTNCPHCKQSLEAPMDMAGEDVECPNCQKLFKIPAIRLTLKNKKCPSCGVSLNIDDKICIHCGLNLETGKHRPSIDADDENRQRKPNVVKVVVALCAAIILGMSVYGVRLYLKPKKMPTNVITVAVANTNVVAYARPPREPWVAKPNRQRKIITSPSQYRGNAYDFLVYTCLQNRLAMSLGSDAIQTSGKLSLNIPDQSKYSSVSELTQYYANYGLTSRQFDLTPQLQVPFFAEPATFAYYSAVELLHNGNIEKAREVLDKSALVGKTLGQHCVGLRDTLYTIIDTNLRIAEENKKIQLVISNYKQAIKNIETTKKDGEEAITKFKRDRDEVMAKVKRNEEMAQTVSQFKGQGGSRPSIGADVSSQRGVLLRQAAEKETLQLTQAEEQKILQLNQTAELEFKRTTSELLGLNLSRTKLNTIIKEQSRSVDVRYRVAMDASFPAEAYFLMDQRFEVFMGQRQLATLLLESKEQGWQ